MSPTRGLRSSVNCLRNRGAAPSSTQGAIMWAAQSMCMTSLLVTGTQWLWRSQPLTEPAVMPATICFWKNMNRSSGGTVISKMSMKSRFVLVLY